MMTFVKLLGWSCVWCQMTRSRDYVITKIHNVFHVSLLEQDTTWRGWVDKALPELEKKWEFEAGNNKKYEVKAIIDGAVYGQQANKQISGLNYLVLWKSYPEEKHTWEPSLAVIHLRKLIGTFYKEYPEKPIATPILLDFVPLMARPTIPKKPKQKRGHPSKGANKRRRN